MKFHRYVLHYRLHIVTKVFHSDLSKVIPLDRSEKVILAWSSVTVRNILMKLHRYV